MAWMWWLSAPVFATVLAACWSWVRSRPKRRPTTDESLAEHRDYLDALARRPRSDAG
ncbi:hypothetical protein [Jatrophihabitans fulvus]